MPLPKNLFSIFFAIIFSAVHGNAQVWVPLGPLGFTLGNGLVQTIAVSKYNVPYLCFQDGTVNFSPSVMKYDGSSWQLVGGAGPSGGPVSPLSNAAMAIDTAGNPCIAFGDGYYPATHALTVMRYNGTSWDTLGPRAFSNRSPTNISIAVDKHNTPYVLFQDYIYDLAATVLRYDGTSWAPVGDEGFSGRAYYLSLALDTGGVPYVAYSGIANDQRASVMKYDGSSWVYVGSPALSDTVAWFTQLMFGSDNTPYLTYCDVARSQKATTVKYNGTSWVPVGNPAYSRAEAWNIVTAMGPNDTPYVCYRDGSADLRITVMKFDGTSWINAGNDRFSPYETGIPVFTVGGNNMPLVGYTDPTTPQYQASVRKLANTFSAATIDVGWLSPELTVYPNPAHDVFFINTAAVQQKDMQIIVRDILGNIVRTFRAGSSTTPYPIAGLAPGTYFISAALDLDIRSAKLIVR